MCPYIDYSLINSDYMAFIIDLFKQVGKKKYGNG